MSSFSYWGFPKSFWIYLKLSFFDTYDLRINSCKSKNHKHLKNFEFFYWNFYLNKNFKVCFTEWVKIMDPPHHSKVNNATRRYVCSFAAYFIIKKLASLQFKVNCMFTKIFAVCSLCYIYYEKNLFTAWLLDSTRKRKKHLVDKESPSGPKLVIYLLFFYS